jgi:hypothetical protein
LLETALPPPAAVLPVPLLPPLLLPLPALLHAAAAREIAAAAATVTARRAGRILEPALLVGVLIFLTPAMVALLRVAF